MELEDVLREVMDSRLADVHTCTIGTVVSFNGGDRPTVDVQPAVRQRVTDLDGASQHETLPVIHAVPVDYPQASGFSIVWPLSPGDTVLVLYPERDTTEWNQSGEVSSPGDERMHGLTGARALPCGGHRGQTISGGVPAGALSVQAPEIRLAGTTPLALATVVNSTLQALQTIIAGAVIVPGDGGASLKTALTGWNPSDVSATKVKGS